MADRHLAEIAEVAVAAAEVVDRDAHAGRRHLTQLRQRRRMVVEPLAFRDFDFDQARGEAVGMQPLGQHAPHALVIEVARGEIDGQAEAGHGLLPVRGLGQRVIDDPAAERGHQRSALQHRDEFARADRAQHRMGPAQQGFGRHRLPIDQIEARLVHQAELVLGQAAPGIGGQAVTAAQGIVAFL